MVPEKNSSIRPLKNMGTCIFDFQKIASSGLSFGATDCHLGKEDTGLLMRKICASRCPNGEAGSSIRAQILPPVHPNFYSRQVVDLFQVA